MRYAKKANPSPDIVNVNKCPKDSMCYQLSNIFLIIITTPIPTAIHNKTTIKSPNPKLSSFVEIGEVDEEFEL